MGPADFTREHVTKVSAGDRDETRRLLLALLPVVRVRVARVLWRYRGLARRRDLAQEAEDLTQEVLVHLFEDGGRVLLSWDPARGLRLLDFLAFVADRTTAGILKSGTRTPWREEPMAPDDMRTTPSREGSPADLAASRDLGQRVFLALKAELSPLGARLFELLFVDEADVDVVCSELTMSRDSVYAWRSRLRRRVRELADALEGSEPTVAAPLADAVAPLPGERFARTS